MNSIPVDASRLGSLLALGVSPDTDPETAQQKTKDGVPAWKVECLHRAPASVEGFQPKAAVEIVKVHAMTAPKVEEMTVVRFVGLVARPWQMGTRSGISLSAEGIDSSTLNTPPAFSNKAA